MKAIRFLLILVGLSLVFVFGFGYGRWYSTRPAANAGRKILYYVDAMHPWYKSDKPGIAPDCGMKLVPVYADGTTQPANQTSETRKILHYRDPKDPANAHAAASVTRLLESGIPARKITLGVPFYGKGWSGCAPGPAGDGLYQPCEGLASGSSRESFDFAYLTGKGYLARDADGRHTLAGLGFVRHWNAAARVPYLYNPATRVFITYDDERSIREKAALVKRFGLRGAMFWELDADRDGVLRRVLSEELQSFLPGS